jgi:hypothetical protein
MSTAEGAKGIIRDGLIAYWDAANYLSNPTASGGQNVLNLPVSYSIYDMIGQNHMYLPVSGTSLHQYLTSSASPNYGPAYYKTGLGGSFGPLTNPLIGDLNQELSGFTLEVIGRYDGSAQTSGFIQKGTNTAVSNVFYPTGSVNNLDWMLQPAQGANVFSPALTRLYSTVAFQCSVTSSLGTTVLTAFAFDTASNAQWGSANGLNLKGYHIHYTVTFDGSRIRLYINGQEDQSAPPYDWWPEPQVNPLYSSTQYIKVLPGGITNGRITNKTNIIETFKKGSVVYQGFGYIHVARIYNRALSSQEVLQNYNAQRGRQGYKFINP